MLSLVIFKLNNSNNLRDGLIAYYRGICILFDLGIKYYILNFGLDPYASSTWDINEAILLTYLLSCYKQLKEKKRYYYHVEFGCVTPSFFKQI